MNRIAVVTGGAGGMGLATAKILGSDHQVILSDVRQERLDAAVADLNALGIEAEGVVSDITDRQSVDALFAAGSRGGADHLCRAHRWCQSTDGQRRPDYRG